MVVGMFVSPESRRGGHGRRLIETAVEAAREEGQTRGAASVRVVLIVEPENDGAQKLYESTGFALWDDTVLERNSGKLSRVLAMVREIVM
jgi:GNAT superfamily N-acetyltransferase